MLANDVTSKIWEKNPILGKNIRFNIVKQLRVNIVFFLKMYQISKSK
jgi:hypothetical protein